MRCEAASLAAMADSREASGPAGANRVSRNRPEPSFGRGTAPLQSVAATFCRRVSHMPTATTMTMPTTGAM